MPPALASATRLQRLVRRGGAVGLYPCPVESLSTVVQEPGGKHTAAVKAGPSLAASASENGNLQSSMTTARAAHLRVAQHALDVPLLHARQRQQAVPQR